MLNQSFDTRRAFGMTHATGHVALLSPTAIAIHDDGNVLGQYGWNGYGHELKKITTGTLPP
jgi:hypothetical protein